MRVETVVCKWYKQAQKKCPWASRIAAVTDGFKCFESVTDYEIWKNQK